MTLEKVLVFSAADKSVLFEVLQIWASGNLSSHVLPRGGSQIDLQSYSP